VTAQGGLVRGSRVHLEGVVAEVTQSGMAFVLIPDGGTLRAHTPVAIQVSALLAEPVFLLAADLAGELGVAVNTFHTWRKRYGPGRPAEELARVPVCPAPDRHVGVSRPQAVWQESRLPEWRRWRLRMQSGEVRPSDLGV
jgi:hypothetical protein